MKSSGSATCAMVVSGWGAEAESRRVGDGAETITGGGTNKKSQSADKYKHGMNRGGCVRGEQIVPRKARQKPRKMVPQIRMRMGWTSLNEIRCLGI